MPNPFTNRRMITDPRQFFGRKHELAQIYSRLEPDQPQNVSIVGEHRIGRSSLLYHVLQTHPQQLTRRPHRYLVVYLDAQGAHTSADAFRAAALRALQANATMPLAEGVTQPAFSEALQGLKNQGLTPIVLLDELECLTHDAEDFDDTFFDWLRSVLNTGLLTLVITSAKPLPELAIQRGFKSTFFGIFTQVNLGEFTEAEAHQYLTQPSDRPFNTSHLHFIRELTHGHYPCRLALAADQVYEHYGNGGWNDLQAAQVRDGYIKAAQLIWSSAPATRLSKTRHSIGQRIKAMVQIFFEKGMKAMFDSLFDDKSRPG